MKKLIPLMLVIGMFSCSGNRYQVKYVGNAFNIDNISNAAVFDFENESDVEILGNHAADMLTKMLEKNGFFSDIIRDEARDILKKNNYDPEWHQNSELVKQMGKELNADLLIAGKVTGTEVPGAGAFITPQSHSRYTVKVMVLDSKTGSYLYQNEAHGAEEEIALHSSDEKYRKTHAAREMVNQCLEALFQEFAPRKMKIKVDE